MSLDAGIGISQRAAAEAAQRAAAEAARRAAVEAQRRAQPQIQPPPSNFTSKQSDANLRGLAAKSKLQPPKAEPYQALAEIKNLPKPDLTDPQAIADYKTQRAQLADNAIQNSRPPKLEDFKGLNGATRSFEFGESLRSYNSQIGDLKKISKEAKTYPDKILSPGEAVIEIDKLPRPDRNNPSAVLDYNNKRAAIADAALMYAKPPKLEDYRNLGLNGATASFEYDEARSYYDTNIRQLTDASNAGGTSILPAMTDAEVNKAADDYIKNHGGVKNEDDAYAVGRDVSALAKIDPEGAIAVMQKVQEKLDGTEYGDNVASGFVDNTSEENIRRISQTFEGETMLENLKTHLLDGDVHDSEYRQAAKIDKAMTGFDPNSLKGIPEQDAKTVDAQLKNLPPSMREKYVEAVLQSPYGQQAIKYAGAMTAEGTKLLGESLGKLYAKDPNGTTARLKQITDAPNASLYPYYYQSGLAYSISKSGNDDLIKSFAQNEINRAKGNPEEVRGYLNAATAYAGLSPDALQDVMKTNPDFYKAVDEAGRLTDGPPSSGGFENGNIWETGLGDLMEKASQIRGADGKATPEAVKLFETVVSHAGSNFRTMEGLGAFFVEHADQLIDKYTNPTDPDTPGSEVLQNFFGNVVYSPIAKELKYHGGSLIEAIMGNDQGEGGVIGAVVQKYLDQANAKSGDGENDYLLGQRIGFLWGGLSKGFFKGVQNYKDKWNDDKEFRDFTFDILGKGLGKIASELKLPGEVVSKPLELVQKLMDAKAEKDKEKQLELFKSAFNDLNNAMFTRLNNYDVNNPNVENMHIGFTSAYNWELVQKLLDDTITG